MNEQEFKEKNQININLTYPRSNEFDFLTKIEIIDLDDEAKRDIESGKGFIIDAPKNTNKKDLKNPNGIYSPKFGQKIGDLNPFIDRYSCGCDNPLRGRINHGLECPNCGKKVRYVDDDFKMFGWIILKDQYHIIHPKFYDSLDYFFGSSQYNIEKKKIKGSKLQNIINFCPDVDQDGNFTECSFKPDNEPFYGIGMLEFYNRFDEIVDYYFKKNPKKKEYYDEIYEFRDIIFCHSIPVFTTHLRPTDVRDGQMYYEPTNAIYNMINKHVHSINKDRRKFDQDVKIKNSELFKVQMKYMELVNEIMEILKGKKGQLRSCLSGRYNFSCRAVIRQDATLRIDQVKLPYVELVKCLQQRIINILIRSYNCSPAEAYDKWSRAVATKDERIGEIIMAIIHSEPEGLPVIINRNPTMVIPYTCNLLYR